MAFGRKKNIDMMDENKRVLIPLWVVPDSGKVTGPYWTPREARNAQDLCGEIAVVAQARNAKVALKERPFL